MGHLRAPARRCGAGVPRPDTARTGSRSGGADAGEDEFVREPALHDLAERYLHLAIEACLDLANHWIADRGLRTPDANRDTFIVLEEAGEPSGDLAGRLRGWAGFRNILVHEYLTIDHGMAYRAIRDELGDLETVARWAAGRLGTGT